jgi:hypothetical protein
VFPSVTRAVKTEVIWTPSSISSSNTALIELELQMRALLAMGLSLAQKSSDKIKFTKQMHHSNRKPALTQH